MNCKVISRRKKCIVRFTKKGGSLDKNMICHTKDMMSMYYLKPKISIHQKYIDLVITSEDREKLKFIVRFIEGVLLPGATNLSNCAVCDDKKRPLFCTHKK